MSAKPDLTPGRMKLEVEYVNRLLGLELSAGELKALLERMRFGVEESGGALEVLIPAYRADILHPIDLVEDAAIAYGYMNFNPTLPRLASIGGLDGLEAYCESVRDIMVGFGLMEVRNLVMTSKKVLFDKMNVSETSVVETLNPVSSEHGVCRSWLAPSVMGTLEYNRSREYPQKIFEIGDVLDGTGVQSRRLSAAVAGPKNGFSEIKSLAEGVLKSLRLEYSIEPYSHESFIEGRCVKTKYGFFGEIHPSVLESFGLEMPVTLLEFTLR
ncbi:MAG TPA: hypothetical protein ENN13_05425 [Candidatus Altiarchaeales archaeon]|nr:hypothetical protein [Candidatus Altiarchaeales archaeon]